MAKGFRAQHGREPVPGVDFDPDRAMCQDDYEYFHDTGYYDGSNHCGICGATERLELRPNTEDVWMCASCASDIEREESDPFGDPRSDEERASDEYYARHPEELACPFCGTSVTQECEHTVTAANIAKWRAEDAYMKAQEAQPVYHDANYLEEPCGDE